jgi:small subunit ribosomal protein S17
MRERKKELVGRVVSDRMQKTVVVAVQSLRRHRLYLRTMRLTKQYMAHDEPDECKIGDLVRIQESRPISRHKHWRVVQVLERAAERGKAVALPTSAVPADVPALVEIAAADVPEDVITAHSGAAPDETGPAPQEVQRP